MLISMAVALGSGPRADAQSTSTLPDAQLRLAHTSPDRIPLDLVIDGRARLFNVPPGATSGYLPVLAGKRRLELRSADSEQPLAPATLEIQMTSGAKATLFPLRSGWSPGAVLVPDAVPPPSDGVAHVRFIHLSEEAPTVWVDIDTVGLDAPPLRATRFVAVTPGIVTVHIRSSQGGPDVVPPAMTELGAGGAISLLVLDGQDGRPQLVTITDRKGRPIPPDTVAPASTTTAPATTPPPAPLVTAPPPPSVVPTSVAPKPSSTPTELALGSSRGGGGTHGVRDSIRALGLVGLATSALERNRRRSRPLRQP